MLALDQDAFEELRSRLIEERYVYKVNGKYTLTVAGADRCKKQKQDKLLLASKGVDAINSIVKIYSMMKGA